ncbi:hypothetical protein SERLA73DRAFT_191499 [Serpula lacrymans var. lacrymans S7.3]|uniref:Uncharacterized protein n=2 Tax=Serpula lacrymans var. lacrymans TaxID=341189 RepID=F8QHQ3_SERL3|nr:uncharacterized protein SERLADRAFT_463922 [Serpula lacrymans var. lacrymans S7.9]EGN92165.1 hypothetical protein SERLA73DRAFT_191499 [Serpula lacrymans var. lacrymans S7.3]EGO26653.1 hypothetical protein SERLADRAFT_463922 [Serpula lacrymans var. lacrymans S7.9]
MFGCCVAGRLLQTNLQQIDETHALFELPAASTINHICVFLLGTMSFPDGYGATVHFFWPGKGFQLLGMLSNEKPSAIFRLRGTFSSSSTAASHNAFTSSTMNMAPNASNDVTAILGLSIEPLTQIQPQISSLSSSVTNTIPDLSRNPSLLAERIVKHLFNFISGFVPGGGIATTPDSVVPMAVIVRWYESFTTKVKAGGVGFLERGD